jgi:hypothetical protein
MASKVGHPLKRCWNCAFSEPHKDGSGKIDFDNRVCKYGPPNIVALPAPNGIQLRSMWPMMGRNDYCGRWEAQIDVSELPPRPAPFGKTGDEQA